MIDFERRQRGRTQRSASHVKRSIRRMEYALEVLTDGLKGRPRKLGEADAESVQRQLLFIGVELVTKTGLTKRGYRLKRGACPLMNRYYSAPLKRRADLYDLNSQCVPVEPKKVISVSSSTKGFNEIR